MTSMYGAASYRIANLFIQCAGGYGGQHRRSYTINTTARMLDSLTDAAMQKMSISPIDTFCKEDQLVQFSTAPESVVGIVNGWETPRLRFMMIVHVKNHVGSIKVTRIQGYTDYADLSMSGHIDPNTKFYINQITEQMLMPGEPAFGQGERVQTFSSSQYLHDTTFSSRGGITADIKNFNMTPQHVFTNMANVLFSKEQAWDDNDFIDTRIQLNAHGQLASRAYELPSQYASTILNTYLDTKASDSNCGLVDSNDKFYDTCTSTLANDVAKKDHFCAWLEARKVEQVTMVSDPNNVFTMRDLKAYDPNVQPEMIAASGDQFDAETMGNSTAETKFATEVINGLVGLMSIYGIARVRFKCSNMDGPTREPILLPQYAVHTFPNINCQNELAGLFGRFKNEVIHRASFCGEMGFRFEIVSDLCVDTAITLKLDNGGEYRYVIPTFCDSLLSPVVTSNKASFDNLTQDFEHIGTILYDSRRHSSIGQPEEIHEETSIFSSLSPAHYVKQTQPQNNGWPSATFDPFANLNI